MDADGTAGKRPSNQGPDSLNAEKPLKIDLPFEEAVRRAMRAGKPNEALKPRDARRGVGRRGRMADDPKLMFTRVRCDGPNSRDTPNASVLRAAIPAAG
jgi:hypothetical protein